MLRPITNWSDLSRALEGHHKAIYLCHECHHVWIGTKKTRARCPCRDCRAWANSPRRDSPGRPCKASLTCGTDAKHPCGTCGDESHVFHPVETAGAEAL